MNNFWHLRDEPLAPGAAEAETVPTRSGDISALASAHAPFVVFDDASLCGLKSGLGMVSLTAEHPIANRDGGIVFDRAVVANLRAHYRSRAA